MSEDYDEMEVFFEIVDLGWSEGEQYAMEMIARATNAYDGVEES